MSGRGRQRLGRSEQKTGVSRDEINCYEELQDKQHTDIQTQVLRFVLRCFYFRADRAE